MRKKKSVWEIEKMSSGHLKNTIKFIDKKLEGLQKEIEWHIAWDCDSDTPQEIAYLVVCLSLRGRCEKLAETKGKMKKELMARLEVEKN